MTNYAAFGEYTAYVAQTKDAASKRYAYMHNLANTLYKMAEHPGEDPQASKLTASLDEIAAVDREMRAALERANQAAALCNQPELSLDSLAKF